MAVIDVCVGCGVVIYGKHVRKEDAPAGAVQRMASGRCKRCWRVWRATSPLPAASEANVKVARAQLYAYLRDRRRRGIPFNGKRIGDKSRT